MYSLTGTCSDRFYSADLLKGKQAASQADTFVQSWSISPLCSPVGSQSSLWVPEYKVPEMLVSLLRRTTCYHHPVTTIPCQNPVTHLSWLELRYTLTHVTSLSSGNDLKLNHWVLVDDQYVWEAVSGTIMRDPEQKAKLVKGSKLSVEECSSTVVVETVTGTVRLLSQ